MLQSARQEDHCILLFCPGAELHICAAARPDTSLLFLGSAAFPDKYGSSWYTKPFNLTIAKGTVFS